jgi:hypothetical protein
MRQLQVGDLCITCNCTTSLLNNGLLVVIIDVIPAKNGGTTPYNIRRVDGQNIPTSQTRTGDLCFFKSRDTWAARSKLRRIDPDGPELVQYRETADSAG